MDIPLKRSSTFNSKTNFKTSSKTQNLNLSSNSLSSNYSPNTTQFTAHSTTDLERHFPAEILAPTSLSVNGTPIQLARDDLIPGFPESDFDSDDDEVRQSDKPLSNKIYVSHISPISIPKSRKLTRTYSENETGNFHLTTGARLYDDEKFRPNHSQNFLESYTASDNKLTLSKTHIPISEEYGRDLTGLEDEYVPGLDFKYVLNQWLEDSKSGTNSNFSSKFASPNNSFVDLSQLHSQIEPKPIAKNNRNINHISNDNEEFEKIIALLPSNFSEFPFSQRRKFIKNISPSIDYSQFSLFAKSRFGSSSTNTYASFLINSLSKSPIKSPAASYKSTSIDDKGSIILNHELGNVIGFGAWGIIRECVSQGVTRAMKIVKTKNPSVSNHFKKEIEIWKLLKHKNILPLIDVLETEDAIFCITDRIYGGTLFEMAQRWGVYNQPKPVISRKKRIEIIIKCGLQILNGIQYMHNLGIVHGDLKLENCLVSESESEVIICDFGMSQFYSTDSNKLQRRPSIVRSVSNNNNQTTHQKKSLSGLPSNSTSDVTARSFSRLGISNLRKMHGPAPQSIALNSRINSSASLVTQPQVRQTFKPYQSSNNEQKSLNSDLPHSHIGSLPYASPELILPSPPPLGPSADIWAFGVLLYTMIVGKLPFQHSYEPRLRAIISAGKYDLKTLENAAETSSSIINIVKGCLEVNITRRWDLDMIIEHLSRS